MTVNSTAAGVVIDIRVNPIIHVYSLDHGCRTLLLDFSENVSERLVAQKTDRRARGYGFEG